MRSFVIAQLSKCNQVKTLKYLKYRVYFTAGTRYLFYLRGQGPCKTRPKQGGVISISSRNGRGSEKYFSPPRPGLLTIFLKDSK